MRRRIIKKLRTSKLLFKKSSRHPLRLLWVIPSRLLPIILLQRRSLNNLILKKRKLRLEKKLNLLKKLMKRSKRSKKKSLLLKKNLK